MLDTPRKTFSPLKSLKEIATPRAGLDVMKTYSTALNSAEASLGVYELAHKQVVLLAWVHTCLWHCLDCACTEKRRPPRASNRGG